MQQLSFEAQTYAHWVVTLVLSGAWAIAFVAYRALRWRRHRAPRPGLSRVTGMVIGRTPARRGTRSALVIETPSGERWQLASATEPATALPLTGAARCPVSAGAPTRLGRDIIADGVEVETRGYRQGDRTLLVERAVAAWPPLRSLELPTVLVCLVHLVTAVALLGDAVI